MERFFKETEFKNWLIECDITSESSAKSYTDYLAALKKSVGVFEKYEAYYEMNDADKLSDLMDDIIQILVSDSFLSQTTYTDKYIKNWKSALPKYTEFLSEDVDIQEEIEEGLLVDADVEINQSEFTIDSADLIKNFTFRLLTQDRYYDEISFPISFIKRIFYKQGEQKAFDDWLISKVNAIQIYTSLAGAYLKLSDIDALSIKNGEVYVEQAKKYYKVYAPTSIGDMQVLKVSRLRDVALDHQVSMFDIMHNNMDALPLIKELSKELTYKLHKPINRKKVNARIKKQDFFEKDIVKNCDLKVLMNELELLSKQINLQLMCKKENIKKGKK